MSGEKIDLNTATAADLKKLSGIGAGLAKRILSQRAENGPFATVADLAAVPGVSEEMAAELGERLFVGERPEANDTAPETPPAAKEPAAKEPVAKEPAVKEPVAKTVPDPALTLQLRGAARAGNVQDVQKLMKAGVDGQDKFALIWAAEAGHGPIVAALLAAGADVNAKTAAHGTNALTLAAQNGHVAVVRQLLAAGADVNAAGLDHYTALMKAAAFGRREIVSLLLDAGADLDIRSADGKTALHLSVSGAHTGTATLLVDRGARN